jgi:cyanate lyase
MLKIGTKRRRTHAQVQLDKEQEMVRLQEVDEKLARLANAEQKLALFDQMAAENAHAKQVIEELQASGDVEIDQNGRITSSKKKL